jgi:hypothetical protein
MKSPLRRSRRPMMLPPRRTTSTTDASANHEPAPPLLNGWHWSRHGRVHRRLQQLLATAGPADARAGAAGLVVPGCAAMDARARSRMFLLAPRSLFRAIRHRGEGVHMGDLYWAGSLAWTCYRVV